MAKLTGKKRASLPSDVFGLPSKRAFPMPDKAHAANAKGRATQQEKKGTISPGQKAEIDAKADRKLGGKPKGK